MVGETAGAIRYFSIDFDPVACLSDLAVVQWGQAGRLRIDTFNDLHVLRAQQSDGVNPISTTALTGQMGKVLRASGVQCDLSVSPNGKHTGFI